MHLGVGHKSYKAHKTSLALMLLALALFVVAALLPLSANIFAVLGACLTACIIRFVHQAQDDVGSIQE